MARQTTDYLRLTGNFLASERRQDLGAGLEALVPRRRPAALAAAVARLADPIVREAEGDAALRRAQAFGVDAVARRYAELYQVL